MPAISRHLKYNTFFAVFIVDISDLIGFGTRNGFRGRARGRRNGLNIHIKQFSDILAVQYAFHGIRAGVLALLFKALWNMYKKSPKGWAAYVVMGGSFILTTIFDINVIFVIIGCAVFGIVTSLAMEKRRGDK